MNKIRRYFRILLFVIFLALFIIFNLYKGVDSLYENPFAFNNVIKTAVFFIIVFLFIILIEKYIKKFKEKEK